MKIKKLHIEDVCDFIGGSQPPKNTFSNVAIPGYIRLIQIRDYKTDNFKTFIPESSTTKFCDEKDIMIGRYGPPIFQICRGLNGAYNVALLKAKPKLLIDIDYLYYFLKQKNIFEYVDKLSSRTGGQTGVDLDCLNKYPIILPVDKHDQKRIAGVLSSLDTKIELNNKICIELESLAKDLYHYWFTQFDFPDEKGNPYRSSGGKMVWNQELGREIPKEWKVNSITDLTPIRTGKEDANFALDGTEYPFFSCSSETLWCDEYAFNGKAILLSGNGDFNVKFYEGKFNAYQRTYVLMPIKQDHYAIVFHTIHESISGLTNGSKGSIVKYITKPDIEKIRLPLPDENCTQLFEALNNYLAFIQKYQMESLELASLRDFLLPLLMNGQVSVRE